MAILVDLEDPAEEGFEDVNGNRCPEREIMLPAAQKPGAVNAAKNTAKAPVVVSPANNTLERVLCIYPSVSPGFPPSFPSSNSPAPGTPALTPLPASPSRSPPTLTP